MAGAPRRRTRARDGALRPPADNSTSQTPAIRQPSTPSRAWAHAHRRSRHPRGGVDRRRLQHRRSTVSTPAHNTSAPSAANSATTRSRYPASTTAYAKATSSPSSPSTAPRGSHESRTAPEAKSAGSTSRDVTVTLDAMARPQNPARRRGRRVATTRLCATRLPPTGRDRRSRRRAHRRLADQ